MGGFLFSWPSNLTLTSSSCPTAMTNSCETPGCEKEASLQCPTCIKLNIQVS